LDGEGAECGEVEEQRLALLYALATNGQRMAQLIADLPARIVSVERLQTLRLTLQNGALRVSALERETQMATLQRGLTHLLAVGTANLSNRHTNGHTNGHVINPSGTVHGHVPGHVLPSGIDSGHVPSGIVSGHAIGRVSGHVPVAEGAVEGGGGVRGGYGGGEGGGGVGGSGEGGGGVGGGAVEAPDGAAMDGALARALLQACSICHGGGEVLLELAGGSGADAALEAAKGGGSPSGIVAPHLSIAAVVPALMSAEDAAGGAARSLRQQFSPAGPESAPGRRRRVGEIVLEAAARSPRASTPSGCWTPPLSATGLRLGMPRTQDSSTGAPRASPRNLSLGSMEPEPLSLVGTGLLPSSDGAPAATAAAAKEAATRVAAKGAAEMEAAAREAPQRAAASDVPRRTRGDAPPAAPPAPPASAVKRMAWTAEGESISMLPSAPLGVAPSRKGPGERNRGSGQPPSRRAGSAAAKLRSPEGAGSSSPEGRRASRPGERVGQSQSASRIRTTGLRSGRA